MQIVSSASFGVHTLPIFGKLNITKFPDLISFCNCLFIYKPFLSKSLSVFSNVFALRSNTPEKNTRPASHGLLTKPSCNSSKYKCFCCFSYEIMEFFSKKGSLITIYVSYPTLNSNCPLRTTFLILTIRNVVKN